MWQVICDTRHVTHDMQQMTHVIRYIVCSQNFSSLALPVWDWQCLDYIWTKALLNELINKLMTEVIVEKTRLHRVCYKCKPIKKSSWQRQWSTPLKQAYMLTWELILFGMGTFFWMGTGGHSTHRDSPTPADRHTQIAYVSCTLLRFSFFVRSTSSGELALSCPHTTEKRKFCIFKTNW